MSPRRTIHWYHVPGHAGIEGNECAHRLVQRGCSKGIDQLTSLQPDTLICLTNEVSKLQQFCPRLKRQASLSGAFALQLALRFVPKELLSTATRLIINTDNIGLFHALLNGSSDSKVIDTTIHQILNVINALPLSVNFKFISGDQNPADAFSRTQPAF